MAVVSWGLAAGCCWIGDDVFSSIIWFPRRQKHAAGRFFPAAARRMTPVGTSREASRPSFGRECSGLRPRCLQRRAAGGKFTFFRDLSY